MNLVERSEDENLVTYVDELNDSIYCGIYFKPDFVNFRPGYYDYDKLVEEMNWEATAVMADDAQEDYFHPVNEMALPLEPSPISKIPSYVTKDGEIFLPFKVHVEELMPFQRHYPSYDYLYATMRCMAASTQNEKSQFFRTSQNPIINPFKSIDPMLEPPNSLIINGRVNFLSMAPILKTISNTVDSVYFLGRKFICYQDIECIYTAIADIINYHESVLMSPCLIIIECLDVYAGIDPDSPTFFDRFSRIFVSQNERTKHRKGKLTFIDLLKLISEESSTTVKFIATYDNHRFFADQNNRRIPSFDEVTKFFDKIITVGPPNGITRRAMFLDLLDVEVRHTIFDPCADDPGRNMLQPQILSKCGGKIGVHHTLNKEDIDEIIRKSEGWSPYHMVELLRFVHYCYYVTHLSKLINPVNYDRFSTDIYRFKPVHMSDFQRHFQKLDGMSDLDEFEEIYHLNGDDH